MLVIILQIGTILFLFQPRFGNIDSNGRNSRWLHHYKSLYPSYLSLKALQHTVFSFCIAPCNGLQGVVAQYDANPARSTRQSPFFFFRALGSLTCIVQHTGPTTLRPVRRTTYCISWYMSDELGSQSF